MIEHEYKKIPLIYHYSVKMIQNKTEKAFSYQGCIAYDDTLKRTNIGPVGI